MHKKKKRSTKAIPASVPALFQGMSDEEVRLMLSHAAVAEYAARTWLYRQDEPSRDFFLLQSGLVRLSQLTVKGEDILVRFIGPGEVFGYFAIAFEGPNVVSAQVVRSSRLAVWDRASALALLQTIPRAAINLFNVAVGDVAYYYARSRHLLVDYVGRRVEWALAELVRTIGVETSKGIAITHGIGQRELAELAGTTIFTVSRELTKLERLGVLKKSRGHIVVLDPKKLLDKW